jgi:hypothetical protein
MDNLKAKDRTAMQRQYTENSKQIFTEMKQRGLVPNSYTFVYLRAIFIYINDRSTYFDVQFHF